MTPTDKWNDAERALADYADAHLSTLDWLKLLRAVAPDNPPQSIMPEPMSVVIIYGEDWSLTVYGDGRAEPHVFTVDGR